MELQDAGLREAGYGQPGQQDAATRGCGVRGRGVQDTGLWGAGFRGGRLGLQRSRAVDAGCRAAGTLGTRLCRGTVGGRILCPGRGVPAAPPHPGALHPHFPTAPKRWAQPEPAAGSALLGLPFPSPSSCQHQGPAHPKGALPTPRVPSPRVPPRPGQRRVAEPVSQSFSFPFQASRGKR